MGENNSSETRVAPLGKFLLENHKKVNDLLSLIGCTDIDFSEFHNENGIFFSEKKNGKIVRSEKSLQPPRYHLENILRTICSIEKAKLFFIKKVEASKVKARDVRLRFAQGEIPLEEAINAITGNNGWANLETASHPDLFIENEKYILLVEGKLTEGHTTKRVQYIPHRSQMVRHIQNTIEYLEKRGEKKRIIAFYILPKDFDGIDNLKQKQAIEEDLDMETVPILADIRQKIIDAYYGCITWEDISEKLGIVFPAIKTKR